jgi:hypothetical protein
MKTREGGVVGYNVQTAVEAEHHLIVAHEVTNDGVDRGLLATMAQSAREAVGTQDLEVLADRGYYKSETILDCTRAGMTPIVPKSMTSNNLSRADSTNRTLYLFLRSTSIGAPPASRLYDASQRSSMA